MIRNDLYRSIMNIIKKQDYFTVHDFTIQSELANSGVNLKIYCNFDNNYFFEVNIPNTKEAVKSDYSTVESYILRGQCSPGDLSTIENINYIGKKNLLDGIANWIGFIKEELVSIPMYRMMNDQKQEINKLETWITSVPDEYFSQEEAKKMNEKLNILEEKFQQKLNEEIKNKQELEHEFKKIHAEIDILKNQIYSLKQPKWWGSLFGRVMNWMADPNNRKLINSTTEVTKLLLQDSSSNGSTNTEGK